MHWFIKIMAGFIFLATAAGLIALLIVPADPNLPPAYIQVHQPEWVKDLRITWISRRNYGTCEILYNGEKHSVHRKGVLPGGLQVRENRRFCKIKDVKTECWWRRPMQIRVPFDDVKYKFEGCYQDNPAYYEYLAKQKR